MNHDEIIEEATQVAHVAIASRWVTVFRALSEDDDYPELLRDIARALADAGLLARPLPSYDEIVGACRNGMNAGGPFPWPAADAVLALLKGQEK